MEGTQRGGTVEGGGEVLGTFGFAALQPKRGSVVVCPVATLKI